MPQVLPPKVTVPNLDEFVSHIRSLVAEVSEKVGFTEPISVELLDNYDDPNDEDMDSFPGMVSSRAGVMDFEPVPNRIIFGRGTFLATDDMNRAIIAHEIGHLSDFTPSTYGGLLFGGNQTREDIADKFAVDHGYGPDNIAALKLVKKLIRSYSNDHKALDERIDKNKKWISELPKVKEAGA